MRRILSPRRTTTGAFSAENPDIRYSLTPAAELDEAKYESAKGTLAVGGEAEFRKWVAEKLPDSAMPYAERFLSERSAMATVPREHHKLRVATGSAALT